MPLKVLLLLLGLVRVLRPFLAKTEITIALASYDLGLNAMNVEDCELPAIQIGRSLRRRRRRFLNRIFELLEDHCE